MARAIFAPAAVADLAAIEEHIAADNPRAAAALLDRFERQSQNLAAQPGIGRQRPDLQPGLRSLAVGRYVIFYRATERGIEVVRVLHGMRDIDRILGLER
jgi:toxin ParE1/3/4